jgi:hypothetical protein
LAQTRTATECRTSHCTFPLFFLPPSPLQQAIMAGLGKPEREFSNSHTMAGAPAPAPASGPAPIVSFEVGTFEFFLLCEVVGTDVLMLTLTDGGGLWGARYGSAALRSARPAPCVPGRALRSRLSCAQTLHER